MDFMSATFDNIKLTTKQQRSDSDQDDQTLKSSRTHHFDHPSKSMSMRSDPLLSLSASDANNMLCFSSSVKDANHTSLFSLYQPPTGTCFGYGGLPVSRYKGPFTPSQWMELEHQALIYKHFVANVPVPSHLLSPLTKSLNTFLFPGSSSSPSSYGWGSFQLGFSGNTDPEPGRCRRTDGKKWRCSRDAVPDQKYCERHINRGRHRSRKPVEGQNGHTVTNAAASKAAPVVSSSATTRPTTVHNHNPAVAAPTQIPNSRTQASDSLMYGTSYTSFMDQGAANPSPNPLPNFVDVWSKDEPIKREWTQLSMATSDFSSCSNSPAQEKLMVPALGLTPEFQLEPTHKPASNWIPISWGSSMGGPLGEVLNQTSGTNDVKVKNLSSDSEMNSLNQMTEIWDTVNHHMGSSPTGVLTKTTFVSLSNSSSSSPKGNKTDEHGGGSLCDELLLSTLAS
ncbi:growth-regulating factor 2-like isoform X1 [Bidens hawaiensis]|uniref:growth-regulating factor 2-like isoform X1 n=1 Tax=Bidens hawaiensis TaxID=980011 RepID=UPI004049F5C3